MSAPIQRSGNTPIEVIEEVSHDAVLNPEASASLLGYAQGHFEENRQSNLTQKEQNELISVLDEVRRQEPYRMICDLGSLLNRPETIGVTPLIQHSLLDSSSLGMFLAKLGEYKTSGDCIKRAIQLDDDVVFCAYNFLENREDVVQEKFRQLWEKYRPLYRQEPPPKYDPPNSKELSTSCRFKTFIDKWKSTDEIEKFLSFQRRFLERVIEAMYVDGQPYNPAFERIFVCSEKSDLKFWDYKARARADTLICAYKKRYVSSKEEVESHIERDNARGDHPVPLYTIKQLCQRIKAHLDEHPIRMVDLHQISHLLKKLGHYDSSGACIEQEWTIDGQERPCTMIFLRNPPELVKQRYQELWKTYSSRLKFPEAYDPAMAPNGKDAAKLEENLSLQTELLEKSVEAMHLDGEPFDPLFEKIELLSVEERIAAGYPLSDIAKRDIIRFVYRKVESDPPSEHAVEEICTKIQSIVLSKEIQPVRSRLSSLMRWAWGGSHFFAILTVIFGFFFRPIS